MSGELALDTLSPTQTGKEATVNLVASELEAAIAGQLGVAGGSTVTLAQMQRLSVIIASGTGNINLPACKRVFAFSNPTSAVVHAVLGTASIAVAAGSIVLLTSDGTANGLATVGSAGSGGGSGGGGSGGLSDAPSDGTIYGREDGAWVAVPSGGGGSGGGSGGGTSAPASIRYIMWRDITAVDSYANIMELAFFVGGISGTQHVPTASYQSNGNSSDGNITHTYDGVDTGNGITANGWAQNLQGGVQQFFLMWDLGAEYAIDTLVYTSRDDYGTQGITSVRQLVSSDGVTFYDVGTYMQTAAYTSSTRTRTIPLGR